MSRTVCSAPALFVFISESDHRPVFSLDFEVNPPAADFGLSVTVSPVEVVYSEVRGGVSSGARLKIRYMIRESRVNGRR